MLSEEIVWKVNQPEKVQALLRAYKHLATIDEVITLLIRPKRIELFAESADNSSALICTFTSSFFNDFRGSSSKIFAVFSRLLVQVTEVHKSSIVSVLTKIRREDFIDVSVEYNSGVVASYGIPFTDRIHEICLAGGPELPLYPSWVADHYVLWDEKIIRLFPGAHEFLAMKITLQGLEVRLYDPDDDKRSTGPPIKLHRSKIQVYEPQKEIEILAIPFARLKTFIETSKKLKFHVQMSPEFTDTNSQAFWQCFDEKKSAYFTLLLGCEASGDRTGVKKETQDEMDLMRFRSMDA
jgi:hypothetical protein